MSCVLADNFIMNNIEHGTHGSTYGGNPLASVIAIEAIKIINDKELMDRVTATGSRFRNTIENELVVPGIVKSVRGRGFLNAIELYTPKMAENVVYALMKNGILTKVTQDTVIRMCPPLTLSSSQYEESMNIILKTINSL